MSFKIVKRTLNSFCKEEFLIDKIREIVPVVNKIAFEALNLLNLYVLDRLENGKKIENLTQTLIYNFIVKVAHLGKRKIPKTKYPVVDDIYEIYKRAIPKNYEIACRSYLTPVLNTLARDTEKDVNNHLVFNFYPRFTKYLRSRYLLHKKGAHDTFKEIYQESYDGDDPVVEHYREMLGGPITDEYIRKNHSKFLELYWEILEFFESYQDQPEELRKLSGIKLKRFSLLPQKRGFTMSYITIDNGALKEILAGLKVKREISEDLWREYFDLGKIKDFRYFQTDGYTVSIVMSSKKPKKRKTRKKKSETESFDIDDYERSVGIDPGRRNVYTAYDNEGNVFRRSSGQYYYNIGLHRLRQKDLRWRDSELKKFYEGMPTNKVSSSEELLKYVRYSLKGIDHAFSVYTEKPYRKWKFKTYIKRQKEMHAICKEIVGGQKTVVGFGDWNNNDKCIKGHARGPVNQIKKELRRYCRVIDIDEYRTSITCHSCKGRLDDEYQKRRRRFLNDEGEIDYKESRVKVYGVLRCKNECRKSMDRDINASKNILSLLRSYPEREECFQRITSEVYTSR